MAAELAEQILTGELQLSELTVPRMNKLFPLFGLRTMSSRTRVQVFRDILLTEAYAYAVPGRNYAVPIPANVFVAQDIISDPSSVDDILCNGDLEPLNTLPLSLMKELLQEFEVSILYRHYVSNIQTIEDHRTQLAEEIARYCELVDSQEGVQPLNEVADEDNTAEVEFQFPRDFEVMDEELGLEDD
jgi:hypothetical protein